MDYGFPKNCRLLKRWEFRQVYDQGTPYRNAGFHLFVYAREDVDTHEPGPSRIGLTATRNCGSAVKRNRLRRWARDFFRHQRAYIKPGYDLVLNFHRNLIDKDRKEFDRLLLHVLRKAHLLRQQAS
ncbi:MAG: ribonuclease P protein component [Candidatus Sumerlaeia bacterium]